MDRIIGNTFRAWLLLIAALALHNVEEWARDLPAWAITRGPLPGWASPYVGGSFGFSLITATALPFVLLLVVRRHAKAWEARWLGLFALVLIINACSHIALSLLTLSLMPGVLTAIILLIPAGLYVLALLRGVAWGVWHVIGAAVIMLAATAFSLAAGMLVHTAIG